jgi:hypothetical protein
LLFSSSWRTGKTDLIRTARCYRTQFKHLFCQPTIFFFSKAPDGLGIVGGSVACIQKEQVGLTGSAVSDQTAGTLLGVVRALADLRRRVHHDFFGFLVHSSMSTIHREKYRISVDDFLRSSPATMVMVVSLVSRGLIDGLSTRFFVAPLLVWA